MFLTFVLGGSDWSASCPGHVAPLGRELSVPILEEAVWAPEPVWMW